ncbi:CAP domain-containing protein [Ammoniphilus sp. YIM 78166]|uniref:CAP domain-containing protein n=1 Tax=Ammoniphilus sp. YIM 78166 TaxID=1644106 RepID=UPI0014310F61|nr:CAP domain-containing protein [Ammoniphilus sp. YIM 78166]
MNKRRVWILTLLYALILTGCGSTYNEGVLPSAKPATDGRSAGMLAGNAQTNQAGLYKVNANRMTYLRIVLNEDEEKMLELINKERNRAGLRPLASDPQLTRLARFKALDMIQDDYFDHRSPRFGSPFTMLQHAGVSYRRAAENVTGSLTLSGAHKALMESSAHRANILNPHFNQVGIGINRGGQYGFSFVQLFVEDNR